MSKNYFLSILVFFSSYALAAGFDCEKASSGTEKMICGNSLLSNLDSELNGAFQTLYDKSGENEIKQLKAEQLNWLRNVRNKCPDKQCLIDAYLSRTKEIEEKSGIPEWTEIIHDDRTINIKYIFDSNYRIESFNSNGKYRNISGKITKCKMLVGVFVGVAGGNESYGGLCVLETTTKREYVKICDDDMVGHFSIERLENYSATIKDLGLFVAENCYGG